MVVTGTIGTEGGGASTPRDEEVLASLYQQHYASMARLALAYVEEIDSAEAVVQDAFLQVWSGRRLAKPGQEIIQLRAAVLDGARQAQQALYGDGSAPVGSEAMPGGFQSPLWQSVMNLPDLETAVLVLRYHENLSEAETAEVLGTGSASVVDLQTRALAGLGMSDSGPEFITDLTRLFKDRSDRYQERPMSYERLRAAAIVQPAPKRGRYPLVVVAIVLAAAGAVGFAVWNSGNETTESEAALDPLQATVIDEGPDGTGLGTSSAETGAVAGGGAGEVEGIRSASDESLPSDDGVEEVATVSDSGAGEANSDGAEPGAVASSGQSSGTDPGEVSTTIERSTSTARPTTEATTATAPEPTTSSTTAQPATSAATTQRPQVASPNLGRLVPGLSRSVADPNGQVELIVKWDPVPGATDYGVVYSVNGNEIFRYSTDGTAAVNWHQGAPDGQYCLSVVARNFVWRDSEPSTVCSLDTARLRMTGTPTYDDDSSPASTLEVAWNDVAGGDRYEVLTRWNLESNRPLTVTDQTRLSVDLGGRVGQICFVIYALDSGGERTQYSADCFDILA